jgi:hypothetical protein
MCINLKGLGDILGYEQWRIGLTDNLRRTFAVTLLAYLVSYFSFLISYQDAILRPDARWWEVFAKNLDQALAIAIVLAVTAFLSFCEFRFEAERGFRTFNTGSFALVSALGAFFSLVMFIGLVRSPDIVQQRISDGGIYAWVSVLFVVMSTGAGFLTMLQIRRARDAQGISLRHGSDS